ncbi:MAG: BamA/TamA family outer membrane protein [Candidatus Solibacter sp.]
MRSPKLNSRTACFAGIVRAIERFCRGTLGFVVFATWLYCATANAGTEMAYGQDGRAQPAQAKPAEGNQEGLRATGEAAGPQSPQPQTAPQVDTKTEQDQANKSAATSSEKKGEWLLAPIPISSPAIGSGLEWAVARVFPLNKKDEVSPPSTVGVAGIFTNNGSRGIAIGGKLYMKEDKYRVAAGFASVSINFDVYGIGETAGKQGVFVPLNVDGRAGIGEFLHRIRKNVYVGARGQYRNATLSLNQDRSESSDITTEPPDQVAGVIEQIRNQLLHQTTVSLGPRFQWDTRDSVFYPKHGLLMEVASDFFSTGLGSKWSYQYYKFSFNKYNNLSEHQVLAFRGIGCAAAGDRVPIYDLCLFGTMNDLRGYPGGRYQDRRMFATQAEYRLMFPAKGFMGRFGVVAFAGVGAIGNRFTDIGASDLLPAGGGGLRFRILKKYPINFRIDGGFGKDGHTLSIGVLEAF